MTIDLGAGRASPKTVNKLLLQLVDEAMANVHHAQGIPVRHVSLPVAKPVEIREDCLLFTAARLPELAALTAHDGRRLRGRYSPKRS